jgi:hypothetical protein
VSEAYTSDSTAHDSKITGQSRLVVVLGDSHAAKETAKKLKSLGNMDRVARGVFLIHGPIYGHQSMLQDLPAISFQKAREIPSVSDRGEEADGRRVFAVVSYRFNHPTATQKKRVERLVRKSTSIRLRPGTLLFPVLKSKDKRRLIEGNQTEVRDAIVRTLLQDISYIEKLAKDLRGQAKTPDAQIRILKKRNSTLFRRYRELKIKWSLAKKIWNYDAAKPLARAYNMVIAARRAIEAAT